jgi:hypothetical protein
MSLQRMEEMAAKIQDWQDRLTKRNRSSPEARIIEIERILRELFDAQLKYVHEQIAAKRGG